MDLPAQHMAASETTGPQTIGKRILVVDKPRFSRLLYRMLAGRYEVICADDAPTALKAMRYGRPDAVVAELSVDGGGVRLSELMEMNLRFAHTPFILTCIKPTPDLIERAKKGGIDNVLIKPFPPSALIDLVGAVLSNPTRRSPLPESEEDEAKGFAEKIREKMQTIDGLPPFPATHAKIMELANSDESNSEAIAEQIQMDPSFLASVLKLANSAHYGFTRQVDSLKLAVTLLGMQEISNLVMSLHVFQEMNGYERESKFDQAAFWKHSVGTAFIARVLAQGYSVDVETSFMAGMLHDIGKVVLDRFFTAFHAEAISLVETEKVSSIEAEAATLGITHADVGGYLAVNWQFADTLTEAIVCHHDPAKANKFAKLASVVHVANAICNHLEFGTSGEVLKQGPEDAVLGKALWKLGLGPQSFEKLIETGEHTLDDAMAFLQVMSASKR